MMVWQISFNKWDPMRLPLLKCNQQQKFNTVFGENYMTIIIFFDESCIYNETYLPTERATKWIND